MAPKQKGGCLDTLDTPWIRHCPNVPDCIVRAVNRTRSPGLGVHTLWKCVVHRPGPPTYLIDVFIIRSSLYQLCYSVAEYCCPSGP